MNGVAGATVRSLSRRVAVTAVAVMLTACGGGGGEVEQVGSASTTVPVTATSPTTASPTTATPTTAPPPPTTNPAPPPTQPATLTRDAICSEAALDQLSNVLWNRWFDEEGANPSSPTPGYLLYAKDVLYEFSSAEGTAWSLVSGTVNLYEYDAASGSAAFDFLPDEHSGELLGVGVVVSGGRLVGSEDITEGVLRDAALAPHFDTPGIEITAWGGTSGRLALECA